MHWMPNPFYLCAGLCSPSLWWNGITQQQVQEQQTWREKHNGRDGEWYEGAERACNNSIYFFTSCDQSFERNILHWHHIQFMAVWKVESTNLCSFYSNKNYTALKGSWSLWIKWLNSQFRLTHKKETGIHVEADFKLKMFQPRHFPEVLQKESLTKFKGNGWRKVVYSVTFFLIFLWLKTDI